MAHGGGPRRTRRCGEGTGGATGGVPMALPRRGRTATSASAGRRRRRGVSGTRRPACTAVHSPDEAAHVGDVVHAAPPLQARQHPRRGARVAERGRAHLDGVGAGEQHLDGVDAARHATDADDADVGERGATVVDGAHRHRTDGRPRQPTAARPRSQTVRAAPHVDGHAEHGVHEHQRLGAGVERRAGDVDDVGDVRAQLHPQRQSARAPTPPRPAAVACAEWANIRLRSSRFGTTDVDLHGDDAGRAGEHRRGLRVLLDACGPRCSPPRGRRAR